MRHALAVALCLTGAPLAGAQEPRMELGLAASATHFKEFEDTGVGVTALFNYRLAGWLAAEAQLGFTPSDLGEPAFSASSFEGFLGLSAGSRIGGSLRWFAALRPGFVRLEGSEEPFACIAIYPPPLECVLQTGRTLPAIQLGAGLLAFPGSRAFVRFEVGGLLLRYPGPASTGGQSFDDSFWSSNARGSLSLGVRF